MSKKPGTEKGGERKSQTSVLLAQVTHLPSDAQQSC